MTTGISLIGTKGSVPTDVQVTDRPGGMQWTVPLREYVRRGIHPDWNSLSWQQDGTPYCRNCTTVAAERLMQCPFCGADDLDIFDVEQSYVGCKGCGAMGPSTDERASAIAAWNTRVSPEASLQSE